jgi:hypothetical protein
MEMGHRLTEIGNKMRVVMNGDGSQKSVTKYELTRAKYELTRLDLIACKLFDTQYRVFVLTSQGLRSTPSTKSSS